MEDKEQSDIKASPVEAVVMPSFEFWAVLTDGELEDEMYGIGIINGLHYNQIDELHNDLKDYIIDLKDDYPLNCIIDFLATNISYNEGQMSFPETGQWDFPPHYEMDIQVIQYKVPCEAA